MKTLIIDRIENGIAVCEREDGSHCEIELVFLPRGAKEGSVIRVDGGGEATLDLEAEAERRKSLLELQDSLFTD